MVALMLVPILGATALAVDVSYWYQKQRSMQNAADSAAIAAAQTGDADYVGMAKGTAARYGYIDGAGSVTVVPSRVTCPSGTGICTQVVIGYTSPLFFAPVVGFHGNKNGGAGQGVSALAIAGDTTGGASHQFCILALDSTPSVDAILANGVPKADVNGCSIFSNSNIRCNGGNLNAGDAIAVGNSSGCGTTNVSGASPLADPYKSKAANIPANSCSSYPQASGNNNSVASTNQISGTYGWSGTKVLCGDIVLTGDVTLSNVNLAIMNGRLIANGHTFTATNSSVVFSGSNSSSYSHYPTDTGGNSNKNGSVFTISAPTDDTNPWHGVAIYQDPALTTNVNIVQSGNEPAFNISGLFYAPNSATTLSGIVNKAGGGYNCFVFVVKDLTLNGTGQIFANALSECDKQDLAVPSDSGGTAVHKWLVQ